MIPFTRFLIVTFSFTRFLDARSWWRREGKGRKRKRKGANKQETKEVGRKRKEGRINWWEGKRLKEREWGKEGRVKMRERKEGSEGRIEIEGRRQRK